MPFSTVFNTVELGSQSLKVVRNIRSTCRWQQNWNHECGAQVWGRGIYLKQPQIWLERVFRTESETDKLTERRTEARDQAKSQERGQSWWCGGRRGVVLLLSGASACGICFGRRFVTSPATPWVLFPTPSSYKQNKPNRRSILEVFMVSLAFAEWQEDVLLRDLSLFVLSLIWYTPQRQGLIMHPFGLRNGQANSFELSTIVFFFLKHFLEWRPISTVTQNSGTYTCISWVKGVKLAFLIGN